MMRRNGKCRAGSDLRGYRSYAHGVVTLTECVNRWFQETGKQKKLVAKNADMLPSKISEIVTGRNPDPQFSTVEKLARGFGCASVEEFLAGPGQRPAKPPHALPTAGIEDRLGDFLGYIKTIEQPRRGEFIRALIALLRTLEQATPPGEAPTIGQAQGETHAAHQRR